MEFIDNLPRLVEYKKRLERQTEILQKSSVFSATEKKIILDCYTTLSQLCHNRIELLASEVSLKNQPELFDYKYL